MLSFFYGNKDLKEKIKILKNNIINKDRFIDQLTEKIKNIKNKNSQLFEQIDKLKLENEQIKNTIKSLSEEKNKTTNIFKKQDSLIEKNLMDKVKENKELKNRINILEKTITDLEMNKELFNYKYRLPLSKLIPATKSYEPIKKHLIDKNLIFVDQISEEELLAEISHFDNYKRVMTLFIDFKNEKATYDVKRYISKGIEISKLFNRKRKFMIYCSKHYLEFLSDLENFDFNILLSEGFSSKQISEYEEIMANAKHLKIKLNNT